MRRLGFVIWHDGPDSRVHLKFSLGFFSFFLSPLKMTLHPDFLGARTLCMKAPFSKRRKSLANEGNLPKTCEDPLKKKIQRIFFYNMNTWGLSRIPKFNVWLPTAPEDREWKYAFDVTIGRRPHLTADGHILELLHLERAYMEWRCLNDKAGMRPPPQKNKHMQDYGSRLSQICFESESVISSNTFVIAVITRGYTKLANEFLAKRND